MNRASLVKEAMSIAFPHDLVQGQKHMLNISDNVLVCGSEVNHKQSDYVALAPLWDSDLKIVS